MFTRAQARIFSTEALKVINDVAKQQFTVSMAGVDAVLGYEQSANNITLVHTDVPPAFQGKGVGRLLAKHAFDYAQKNHLNVTCQCDFLAKYYQNNLNKYKDLHVKIDLEDD